MFFFEWDVVSQHTLISAAHGIVYDLAKKRGIGGSIKDSTLISPHARKDFIKAVNFAQNFLKHADRDSGRKMVFRYNASPFYLFDAVRLFVLLYRTPTYTMKVFLMWFQLQYPGLLCFESFKDDLEKIREVITDPAGLKAYAKMFIEKQLSGEQGQSANK